MRTLKRRIFLANVQEQYIKKNNPKKARITVESCFKNVFDFEVSTAWSWGLEVWLKNEKS